MRGKIIHYNGSDGKGLTAASGRQFSFDISQWRSESAPAVNQVVDLQLDGEVVSAIRRVPDEVLLREKAAEVVGRLGGLGAAALGNLRGNTPAAGEGAPTMVDRLGRRLIAVHALFAVSALALPYLRITHPFVGSSRSFTLAGLADMSSQLGSGIGGGVLPWLAIGAIAVPLFWRSRWAWLALLLPLLASLVPVWDLFAAIRRTTSQASAFDQRLGSAVTEQLLKMLDTGPGLWVCLATGLVLAVFTAKRILLPPR